MKNALVIGASGSFGAHVTRELVSHGWHVRALQRPGGRRLDANGVRVVPGSALDLESVRAAARGVDTIVYSYNVPYPKWHETLLPAADVVSTVARETSATVLFPGNVYGLQPSGAELLSESAARHAPTRKGRLRNAVEQRLKRAAEEGARVVVLRAGDFMGGDGQTSWFATMTARLGSSNRVLEPSRGNVRHEWAYLPDLARAAQSLLERANQLSPYAEYNFSSYQVTGDELRQAIVDVWGEPFKTRSLPWPLVRILSPFVPMFRELHEMRYLWFEPLLLDDSKLMRTLPGFDKTPLRQAVEACLRPTLERRAAERRQTWSSAA